MLTVRDRDAEIVEMVCLGGLGLGTHAKYRVDKTGMKLVKGSWPTQEQFEAAYQASQRERFDPKGIIESLPQFKSAVPGETWRTLLQTFRTKIFLALSDDFSASERAFIDIEQYYVVEGNLMEEDDRHSVITVLENSGRAIYSSVGNEKRTTDRRGARFGLVTNASARKGTARFYPERYARNER